MAYFLLFNDMIWQLGWVGLVSRQIWMPLMHKYCWWYFLDLYWSIYQMPSLVVNLLISCGVFKNLVTNNFSILNLTTSHWQLNTPTKNLLKLQQVLVGENLPIEATEHHHVMVAHDEISSTSLCWEKGQQGAGTILDSIRWCCHHQTPSFWVKNVSLMLQQQQQDRRL